MNTGKEVAKDVWDVSDSLCQIRLTTMKSSKKKPKAKPIREERPTSKQPKRQAMVLVPAAWNVKVGSNVRRAHIT